MTPLDALPARMPDAAGPTADGPGPDSDEVAWQVRRAARASCPPETLCALARDGSVTVRAAVAMNPSYAPEADAVLMNDADERVRALLASKVARLLPGLTLHEHTEARAHVHRTLASLANDAADRVRCAIANAVRTMPGAPRTLILQLARDPSIMVSEPIVRCSPLLTDADLLDLLATPAHPAIPEAVAGREGLGAEVADRIATHAEVAAVRVLLANASAAIRESTLEALVGRAAEHPEWHEPLVHRPALPGRVALRLMRMVAGHLLEVLVRRDDLPPEVTQEVRAHLERSLDQQAVVPPDDDGAMLDGVRRLAAAGLLTEAVLIDAAEAGDHRQLAALLAVASGVLLAAVDRAVALRSAKALVSLVWKAGFTMRAGVVVQSVLGHLGLEALLSATPEGGFPLTANEMDWQVELMASPCR